LPSVTLDKVTKNSFLFIFYYSIHRNKTISHNNHIYITTAHNCFAECFRHSARPRKHSANSLSSVTLDKEVSVNCTLATAYLPCNFLSGTRQRLCQVSPGTWQIKVVVTAPSDGDGHSAKALSLPSVTWYLANKSRRHSTK
jgi:hypothetical protein